MQGVLLGYGRTATTEQLAGLEAQQRDLKAAGCAKIFEEQVSSMAERPQLEAALEYARKVRNTTIARATPWW
jgi:DNA invertase Pin-like site-specific DNA recombinase